MITIKNFPRVIFMVAVFFLGIITLVSCKEPREKKQDDLLAHWRCDDGNTRYVRTLDECQNGCSSDNDCTSTFYDGPCGKEKGVFLKDKPLPHYEAQRCNDKECSITTPSCALRTMDILVPLCNQGKCVGMKKERKKAIINGKELLVTLAETPEDHANGLMYVSNLEEYEGMLFAFNPPIRASFWMKNTLIPLDIIFIDKDNKIILVYTAQPCTSEPCQTYSSPREAAFVLEVRAGTANETGFKVGDEIKI